MTREAIYWPGEVAPPVSRKAFDAMRDQRDYLLGFVVESMLQRIEVDQGEKLGAEARAHHREVCRAYLLAQASTPAEHDETIDAYRAIARGERT